MKIGFGHKQRSGKDTAADYLISKYGGMKLKFADPLYEIESLCHKFVNLPPPNTYTKAQRRDFLQFIGTQWGRTLDYNVWARMMDDKLTKLESIYQPSPKLFDSIDMEAHFFVTDVRFPNEVEVLKKHGFTIIRIDRSEELRDLTGNPNHESEISLDGHHYYDHIIDNNGTLEELYAKLELISQF
jgi:hypothetical protein